MKDRQSLIALMLVVCPLPDEGSRYTVRRGGGLFISYLVFGDTKVGINRISSTLLLYI